MRSLMVGPIIFLCGVRVQWIWWHPLRLNVVDVGGGGFRRFYVDAGTYWSYDLAFDDTRVVTVDCVAFGGYTYIVVVD